ncbi:hypothetical protein [Nocardioides mangrovi]|uniref:Uncharacterized protein n=1 Tax=Nocardioides mangrovi TaxID=2874580 RepID=A0ABS7UAX4_9ACTN|nr:hypothetical protein [Nocardioides mangrovi]MBZ5738158.1 hypothetical protein [Nocardioides mangrovi]
MSLMTQQPSQQPSQASSQASSIRSMPLHIVHDPQPGFELAVPAGARLALKFRRRGLGLSRWHLLDRPGHLVPLEQDDHGFLFLVFPGGDDDRPLRLVRRRVDRAERGEVRTLTIRVC